MIPTIRSRSHRPAWRAWSLAGCCLAMFALAPGCNDKGSPTQPPPKQTSSADQAPEEAPSSAGKTIADLRVVTTDSPLEDYLPPLDEGRVLLAPPLGWERLPRSADYVVRFKRKDAGDLPRIVVTAMDWEGDASADDLAAAASGGNQEQPQEQSDEKDAAEPAAVAAGNTSPADPAADLEIMKQVEKLLKQERQDWVYGPEIFLLNQRPVIVYKREASAHGVPVEIIGGELVIGSRRYRFELQSYPEFIEEARLPLFTAIAAAKAP